MEAMCLRLASSRHIDFRGRIVVLPFGRCPDCVAPFASGNSMMVLFFVVLARVMPITPEPITANMKLQDVT
jgi:hypothetical protein